ncbi:hypothetical protein J6590_084748 [Homalodisca vitripennis]|nr:hypothetical protein J6590_084748 [Homalodisca vitripennis]
MCVLLVDTGAPYSATGTAVVLNDYKSEHMVKVIKLGVVALQDGPECPSLKLECTS